MMKELDKMLNRVKVMFFNYLIRKIIVIFMSIVYEKLGCIV